MKAKKSQDRLGGFRQDRVLEALNALDDDLEELVTTHQPEHEQQQLLEPLNRRLSLLGFRIKRIPRNGRCQYCKDPVPDDCNCCASCSDANGP